MKCNFLRQTLLVLILIPNMCLASGSNDGYMLLGFLLCIPSFVVIGLLFYLISSYSKKTEFQLVKVGFICFGVLVFSGFSLTDYGALYPNWVAFVDARYVRPFVSALILCLPLLMIYRKKWEQKGGKKLINKHHPPTW